MIVDINISTMNPCNFSKYFLFCAKKSNKNFSGTKKILFFAYSVQNIGCLRSYSIQVPLIHTGQGFLGYLWVYSVLEDNVSYMCQSYFLSMCVAELYVLFML